MSGSLAVMRPEPVREWSEKNLPLTPNLWLKQNRLGKAACGHGWQTFTTRMCKAGVNVKLIQDVLGHNDILH